MNSGTQVSECVAKRGPYPAYKPSGIEWLGKIPAHWDARRLKFVSTVIMGQSPPSEDYNTSGNGLPFLQGNADFGTKHPEPRVFCPAAPKTVKAKDHLISVRAPVGALNTADQDYGIGRGLCAVRIRPPLVDNHFAWWSLVVSSRGLDSVAVGSTYEAVSAEDVAGLAMPLPQDTEQRAIADFLDRETARIDALMANKERLTALLQEKRTALISHAVTKGLDPNARMKPSGIEWLGEVPAHWEVKRLGFNASFVVPMRDKPEDLTGEIPWIRIEDFEGRYISGSKSGQGVSINTIREMNLKVFPIGTVLCSCSCNMGATAIVDKPLVSNQTFIGIVPGDKLVSEYVYYLMQVAKEHLTALATGAIQQYLSRNDFRSLRMPLLPEGEQRAIADFLDRETARIDVLMGKVKKSIELLREYRTALISSTVTGKIDVREEAA